MSSQNLEITLYGRPLRSMRAHWKLFMGMIHTLFPLIISKQSISFSYYDQLVALESKIPSQELQVPFKWRDAFDRGNIFGTRMSLSKLNIN